MHTLSLSLSLSLLHKRERERDFSLAPAVGCTEPPRRCHRCEKHLQGCEGFCKGECLLRTAWHVFHVLRKKNAAAHSSLPSPGINHVETYLAGSCKTLHLQAPAPMRCRAVFFKEYVIFTQMPYSLRTKMGRIQGCPWKAVIKTPHRLVWSRHKRTHHHHPPPPPPPSPQTIFTVRQLKKLSFHCDAFLHFGGEFPSGTQNMKSMPIHIEGYSLSLSLCLSLSLGGGWEWEKK